MSKSIKITGNVVHKTSCGDVLDINLYNDGSMTAFFRPVTGGVVYMTHSMLKMFKGALVNLNMDVV